MMLRRVLSRKLCSKVFLRTYCAESEIQESQVIIKNRKNAGLIILNRPESLNELNLNMIRKIYTNLQNWEDHKSLVIIKACSDYSFCSGADVRAVRSKDKEYAENFFKEEYQLSALIGSYKIPYIAFINGIVMGGGVGLAVHGQYRIATENTIFSMPATQLGLLPDVGGSYFLPRLGGKLGWYLALTGHQLKGSDVVKAGIATHFCESKILPELELTLVKCANEFEIRQTLLNFNMKEPRQFSLIPYLDRINKCFSGSSIEDVFKNLHADGSDWAVQTMERLSQMSPTSLKVSFKELEMGSKMSLEECLRMEYRLAIRYTEYNDFAEGVRAHFIDKDNQPNWAPKTLQDVTEESVNDFFLKLPEDKELKPNSK